MARRQSQGRRTTGGRKGVTAGTPRRFWNASAYLLSHAQVMLASLGRMYRSPVSTLMTVAVIGIALALPATLLVLLNNLQEVTGGWDGQASISVFLRETVTDTAALESDLGKWPEIHAVQVIPPAQALEEFQRYSGFGDTLKQLPQNPLPTVIVIEPGAEYSSADATANLVARLESLPEVELVQLDLQWVKRLSALMELGRRGIMAIGALLAVGVLLVIGNTIRLEIENRREEIEVTKLVGATDGFVRRPFLYSGLWHGLLGALMAWLLVQVTFLVLHDPVYRLAGLYGSRFELHGLGIDGGSLLLAAGSCLGLAGSWLAVGRHLGAIQPA